jgi:hypothetical protein
VPAAQADLQEVKQAIDSLRDDVSRGTAGHSRRYDWTVLTAIAALAGLIVVVQLAVVDRRSSEPAGPVPRVEAVAEGIERLTGRLGDIDGRLDALAIELAETLQQARAAGERTAEIAERAHGITEELAGISVATASVAQEATAERGVAPTEVAPELILHHHLRLGETLWSVAKRYYGQGHLYPVLFLHNPGLGPYHRGARTLRILADPEEAAELYRQITPPGREGRLFRYRVGPGDDWRGLARRFLGRPERASELMALNPESELTPGEQVLIALE